MNSASQHYRASKRLDAILKLLIGLWVLLAVAAVFVMTLGTDEAWVLNGLRSSLRAQVPQLSTELIVTSGGPFALANLAVEWGLGSQVWAHRLVSLGFLGGAAWLALRLASDGGDAVPMRVLLLAPLVGLPGAAEVGTAALGTSTGLCLMFAAMAVWTSAAWGPGTRVSATGVLYGLAAASRFDLVLFGPALILASFLAKAGDGRSRYGQTLAAAAAAGMGLAIFVAGQWLMSLPANAAVVENIGPSTGLSGFSFDYPKLLNHWAAGVSFVPIGLMAVAVVVASGWADDRPAEGGRTGAPTVESLLWITGAMLSLAWLFRAPIPHLRYLFPALSCFGVLGGLGLYRIAVGALRRGRLRQVMLCQMVALACVVGGLGGTVRSLLLSDSDIVSWEWSREMPLDYFRRFDAKKGQLEAVEYIRRELPADAMIYAPVPYALRYLADRPILALEQSGRRDEPAMSRKHYVVLSPAVGTYFSLRTDSVVFLRERSKLVKQAGRYSIYELLEGAEGQIDRVVLDRASYLGHPATRERLTGTAP